MTGREIKHRKSYSSWTDDYGNTYTLPGDGDFHAGSPNEPGDRCDKCSRFLQVSDIRQYKGKNYGISCGCAQEIPSLMRKEMAQRLAGTERSSEDEQVFDYDSELGTVPDFPS